MRPACRRGHAALRVSMGLAGLALLLTLAGARPVWARGGDCVFRSSGQLLLAFGSLDPGRASSLQQRATATRREDLEAGDCARGKAMRILVEGGQHDLGGRLRMKHALRNDAYLRYTVQAQPTVQAGPGNGRYLGFELIGRLDPADFANAPGGVYSDTLRLSVRP
jgi:hypothetical protein